MRKNGNNILLSGENSASIAERDEIDVIYKWDLTHIYENEEKWEDDFKWIESNLKRYKEFEGKLSNSASQLLKCLKFEDEIGIKFERLHLYAMLSKDLDMRNTKYLGMFDIIQNLSVKISSSASFIRPEILTIDGNKLKDMLASNDELKIYAHLLSDILRVKEHILMKDVESVLALTNEITQIPYNTFSIFTNADMKFPVVESENGVEVEISHAKYYAAMYSQERGFRARAYKAYYKQFIDHANTFSTLFNGNLKTNIFVSSVRKYKSAKEASLDRNNIPVSVYDNLVTSVNQNLKPLHRWGSLRKKIMKIDELHPYDVYVSLFQSPAEKNYDIEEAKKMVLTALSPIGKEYLSGMQKAFDNRWIDVFETKGKRSGAYSSGTTFGVHPYILLNWTGLLNDVFTLAHEMGHNMHSYYTGNNQPFPYAGYSIFLAEVASTFNESLLLDYMISNAKSKGEKLFLIEKYLNNITSTFYRQTMFAEFESDVYEKSQQGIPLTPDILRMMFKALFQKYWGNSMVVDEEEEYTWARIPHFYYNFYVFQYATGFAASEILTQKVKKEGKYAVNKYLEFLKAGSSDYAINILNKAGVDMNSPDPIAATSRKMNDLLDEMENLIN